MQDGTDTNAFPQKLRTDGHQFLQDPHLDLREITQFVHRFSRPAQHTVNKGKPYLRSQIDQDIADQGMKRYDPQDHGIRKRIGKFVKCDRFGTDHINLHILPQVHRKVGGQQTSVCPLFYCLNESLNLNNHGMFIRHKTVCRLEVIYHINTEAKKYDCFTM